MARSFSNAKIVSALVANAIGRRGYAAASQGAAANVVGRVGTRSGAMLKKPAEEATEKVSSWVPDPVTGFYRPENMAAEIDAAELRAMLLKNKTKTN